ncbi:DNA-binding cell division cycle control protein [Klebsormidium nitens]|uniref:DNA-binding cell division cycle control protein n=1 Tax=Klebsormidium nitens TaxID=105231 RepID=A0A1Y1I2C3_KLENI|nr:DNA-binding cell division cycle control protein [Klebsormidium nitens]|eukprot:GAQ84112.1 DNA-binding cell division cycle control protein [Klebsormidium nitens]
MEAVLQERVAASLQQYMLPNATFLCERLCAGFPTEANKQLLASCYFRANQAFRAFYVLQGLKSPESRYLYALCCFQLGKLPEAEAALTGDHYSAGQVVNGAAGHYLLGLICKRSDRRETAVRHFSRALALDPLLWSAFEELCNLGAHEAAGALFGDSAVAALSQIYAQRLSEAGPRPATDSAAFQFPDLARMDAAATATPGFVTPAANGPSLVTPSVDTATPSSFTTPVMPGAHAPAAGRAGPSSTDAAPESTPARGAAVPPPVPGQRRKFVDEGKLRKVSGRLFSEPPLSSVRRSSRISAHQNASDASHSNGSGGEALPGGSRQDGGHHRGQRQSGSQNGDRGREQHEDDEQGATSARRGRRSESREDEAGAGPSSEHSNGDVSRAAVWLEGARQLLALLRQLGEAYRLLAMYRCKEAAAAFGRLPQQHYATAWVLCQVGRAHFEMVDYKEAERAFSWARRLCPHRLEGLDVYSTLLWHMKKEVELSYLAQEAIALDRMSPYAWCVLGNCFSLQREHEAAVRFFQRALQLDPHHAYAHTLAGHEHLSIEDWDEALTAFRAAIRLDARHYNAWYGLGTIYYQQEKFELAEYHFRRALSIHPGSSVLHCYLGMSLHALKRDREALQLLDAAIAKDARNPLPKFEKAAVLFSQDLYEEALAELEALKEVAPKEASLYFLMGKIFKKLDNPDKAMLNFSTALDLKPSNADVNQIKAAIEKLSVPDDGEGEEL